MDTSLRNRLTLGPILLAFLLGVLAIDWWIERATAEWAIANLKTQRGIAGAGLAVLLAVVAPLAVRELARLFAAESVKPYRIIAAAGTIGLIGHAWLTQFPQFQPIGTTAVVLILVIVMLLAALRRALERTTEEAIVAMAGTVLATLYIGGLMWFLVALRVKDTDFFTGSTVKVVFILLCVKFTDIGAFATGKTMGRHKLIKWLSPGKTWEGLAGGVLTAAAVGAIVAGFIDDGLPWWKGAIFGAILGVVGQGGDLLESMLKRDAQVKDSGQSIPGFGGVLDVIDSPLLAAPVAYLLFSLF
jgi:phosphatidate cytidylyltransferase